MLPDAELHEICEDVTGRRLIHGAERHIPRLLAEIERLKKVCASLEHNIVSTLAPVLYPDDPETGLPTHGEHVAETLAIEAAREIKRLKSVAEYMESRPMPYPFGDDT